ncbi:sensor histidine kinase [Microbacterium sp. A94]|uniref:sensor histidine kinase n=1 Tax=Microbacterium sp. A94 TaxID=3450717 RepID=UPI003F6DE1EA
MTSMRSKKRAAPQPAAQRRWPWPRNRHTALIVILTTAAVALYSVLVPVHVTFYGSPVAMTMLLGAIAVAAPLVSLRYPRVAMIGFTASAVLIPLMVSRQMVVAAPWPWSVPLLIAFAIMVASVTFRHGWRYGLIQLIVGAVAGVIASVMLPAIPSGNSLIVTTSILTGVYLLSFLLVGRLRLGDELTRERALTAQEQSRRELVEERTRIARELHDVVAHSLSLIQVQASTARYRVPDLAPSSAAEFESIAASARESLSEMRRILGVLRMEDHTADLAPQRGIEDIAALVDATRRAGAAVSLIHHTAGEDVSASTGLAVYRIVQESLSNAVRHAPGTAISVTVTDDDSDIVLIVHNVHSPQAGDPAASQTATVTMGHPGGHGLRGMTERATLLGGSIQAGDDADGGWTVAARVPKNPLSPPAEGNL